MSLPIEINQIHHFRFSICDAFQFEDNNTSDTPKDICDKKGNNDNYYQKYFLQCIETKDRIETDIIGKEILNRLPASFDQLSQSFNNADFYVSPKLLRYYLMLFYRAGVIRPENEEMNSAIASQEKVMAKDLADPETGEMPKISVVIVSFNGEKFLHKNLHTLTHQTLPAAEIIIVDNASTDGSIEKIAREFPEIKVIRNKRNYHYAQAVNIGVAAANHPFVIILNQDLEAEPDFIQHLYLRYEAEQDKIRVAGVVPQMRFSRLKAFINGIGNFITAKNWGSDNYFGVLDIGQFKDLQYTGSACFGAIMVTKSAWSEVGPLDKKYKSFYEDADWSMRAHLKGMNLLTAPKAIVYHAFGGSYPSGLKLALIVKNRMRFVFKHLKGKNRATFFKKYFRQDVKNALSFLRCKSYRNTFAYIKAYIKLFFQFPNIIIHRIKRDNVSPETIEAFFTKCTPYVALANKQLNPVINKHVIRSYYYYTEISHFQYPDEPITL